MRTWIGTLAVAVLGFAGVAQGVTLAEQNEALFQRLKEEHGLTDDQMTKIRAIFSKSGYVGQGNPDVTHHPMTTEQCKEKVKAAGVSYDNPVFEKICGGKHMAPLFDPAKGTAEKATSCIDQFEFPDIPCDYPVVWVRAKEAEEICEVMGKRMCDAHEWEGGCAGAMDGPDYDFASVKGLDAHAAQQKMRFNHNRTRNAKKTWSYGPAFQKGVCGQNSTKDDKCNGGDWKNCGSNTYPSGSFPNCHSKLDVYDINGNAAEHMNLPTKEDQMTSKGSKELGVTEMKGSWFIWDKFQAHDDSCRWRAPYWHGSKVMDPDSHHNYHLGFRCCKNVGSP